MTNDDRGRLLLTLLVLAALTFTSLLTLYLVVSPNRLSARLAFAAFISVVPALASLTLFYVTKLRVTRVRVIKIYFGMLVLTQIVMEALR